MSIIDFSFVFSIQILSFKLLYITYITLKCMKFNIVPKISTICLSMSLFLLYYISGKQKKQQFNEIFRYCYIS